MMLIFFLKKKQQQQKITRWCLIISVLRTIVFFGMEKQSRRSNRVWKRKTRKKNDLVETKGFDFVFVLRYEKLGMMHSPVGVVAVCNLGAALDRFPFPTLSLFVLIEFFKIEMESLKRL